MYINLYSECFARKNRYGKNIIIIPGNAHSLIKPYPSKSNIKATGRLVSPPKK